MKKHTYIRPDNYKKRKDSGKPRGIHPRTRSELKTKGTPLALCIVKMDMNINDVARGMKMGSQTLKNWVFNGREPRNGVEIPMKFIAKTLNITEDEVFLKIISGKNR